MMKNNPANRVPFIIDHRNQSREINVAFKMNRILNTKFITIEKNIDMKLIEILEKIERLK